MKKVLFVIPLLLILSSCKSKDPEPTTGETIIFGRNGNSGYIKVYVDGSLEGTITKYLSSGTPECGQQGFVTIKRRDGYYKVTAIADNGKIWDESISVSKGKCKSLVLL